MSDLESNVENIPTTALVQPLFPKYLHERVTFDADKVVLASSIPQDIMMQRNILIRWIQFELAETFAGLSFGFIRSGIAKTSLFLNLLLLFLGCCGMAGVLTMAPMLVAFHAMALFSICVLFGLYIVLIALTGDESWWLLMAIFAFITVDYVVAWKSMKLLRALASFEKTLTEDSPLLIRNSVPVAGVGGTRAELPRSSPPTNNNSNSSNSRSSNNRGQAYTANIESQMLQIENYDTSDAPNQFLCPIALSLMVDPVVAMDGHTYERMNIENWFKTKKTSPLTRSKIKTQLVPNQALKSQIQEYLDVKRRANTDI